MLRPQEQLAPVVFCSPHSGRIYPKAFLDASRLDPHTLRKSEDCFVDELFEAVVALGAPLIAARFPRAYLDVNREPYELDPELFTGRVPEFANTQSARVVGGLGTIARIVADTEEIYRERLPIGAAFERIERLYRPFHAALADLLEETRKRFGIAILIDCHSMPSASMGQIAGRAARTSCSATASAPRATPSSPASCATCCTARATRCSSTDPMPADSSPSTTATPCAACSPCSSRSTARLYLDEAAFAKNKDFRKMARVIEDMAVKVFAALPLLLERRAAAE